MKSNFRSDIQQIPDEEIDRVFREIYKVSPKQPASLDLIFTGTPKELEWFKGELKSYYDRHKT